MPLSPRVAAIAAGVLLVAGLGVGAVLLTGDGDSLAACREGGGTVGADIGGPFELVRAADGATVTADEVIDRPTFVYFGYTYCPDFCPFDAVNMAEAQRLLDENGVDVRSVFVTIDPDRDTPEALREFSALVHPEMIGLTGSDAQIADAAREYRVYYARAGEADDPYYLMDHSTFTYLMHPEVGFLDFFRHGTPPEDMAERVSCYVDALS